MEGEKFVLVIDDRGKNLRKNLIIESCIIGLNLIDIIYIGVFFEGNELYFMVFLNVGYDNDDVVF